MWSVKPNPKAIPRPEVLFQTQGCFLHLDIKHFDTILGTSHIFNQIGKVLQEISMAPIPIENRLFCVS